MSETSANQHNSIRRCDLGFWNTLIRDHHRSTRATDLVRGRRVIVCGKRTSAAREKELERKSSTGCACVQLDESAHPGRCVSESSEMIGGCESH